MAPLATDLNAMSSRPKAKDEGAVERKPYKAAPNAPDPLLAVHLRNVLRGVLWDECHTKALDIVQLALIAAADERVWQLVRKQLLDVYNAHERQQSQIISQLFMLEEETNGN